MANNGNRISNVITIVKFFNTYSCIYTSNMSIRFIFSIVSLLCCFSTISAQQIDSVLNIYADSFMQEKVHIHFDRSVYNKDETVYYKAYLLEDHDLSSMSKNLYVDWYDPLGKLLKQTVSPIFLSGAKGSFEIPANYTAKTIGVKAYTKWMLNFDTAFIYNRVLTIHQPRDNKKRENENILTPANSTHVHIYPEGGFAVAALTNKFAFKATDQLGNPVFIKGIVRNNKGEQIDSLTALHDGMGVFSLLLQQGKKYFFDWTDEQGKTGATEILAQKEAGACIQILPGNKKALFTIERSASTGEAFKTMHLLVHKNQNLRYKLDLNMSEKTIISSEISTDDLPAGIVQFTLFDANWIPVAERIIFVNNQNHSFYPEIQITKKDLTKKGKNQLEVFVPDTLLSNMSIAVTDAGAVDPGEPTIFSDFLLSDEIRGKVNNPAYYFSNEGMRNSDKVKDSILSAHLDLVMLTHGHRRFDWEKIAKGKLMDIHYPAETDYLQIKGKVAGKNVLKSKEQLSLNVMLLTKDSSKSMFVIPVQKDGSFTQKNAFYYDSIQLFYSLNGKKLSNRVIPVKFENSLLTNDEKKDFFAGQQMANNRWNDASLIDKSAGVSKTSSLFEEQDKLRENKLSGTLEEVKVTTRVKSKKQILDEFYTRGVFAGEGNNYTIDVEGDISSRSLNIWDYLQSKIPGLTVVGSGSPEPGVFWFRNSSFSGDSTPALFLDEAPVSLSAIGALATSSIAYVKAFRPPFVGAFLNGPNGAIAIYTKKGYSPVYNNTNEPGLQSSLLSGYNKFKEFIQPDYNDSNSSVSEPDYRTTVYFNPYVLTAKSSPRVTIDFYNNDISKKLYVVLEGIDAAGKMARVVKIVE